MHANILAEASKNLLRQCIKETLGDSRLNTPYFRVPESVWGRKKCKLAFWRC